MLGESELDAKVLALHEAGYDWRSTAAELGVGLGKVTASRKRLGIARALGPSAAWRKQAEELLKDNVPYAEVARTVGVHQTTIAEAFPGMGWTRQECIDWVNYLNRVERRGRTRKKNEHTD